MLFGLGAVCDIAGDYCEAEMKQLRRGTALTIIALLLIGVAIYFEPERDYTPTPLDYTEPTPCRGPGGGNICTGRAEG